MKTHKRSHAALTRRAYRDFLKSFGAGAATWFGYYGGGMKKVWLDKA